MATKTTNYGLTKPEGSDFYDIGVQNDNMDIIDKQMKANAKDIAQLNSEIKNKVYMQPAWVLTCEKFEGGYFKINNVVFLNIRLKNSATNNNWSGSGTWKQIFKNLPKPLIEIPLQCYCETYSDKYTPCYISTDGNAYVMGANQIEPGTIYLFQAVYLSNE